MAELYAKPYEVIDTGYNPQQTQQGGQDAEMQSYLQSLPPEERQKAIQRINAPLTGEELAVMAQSGQRMPTLEDYAEIEKYHKNQEVSFIDGLGKIAEGGEQVMTDLSNAFASFISNPADATSKMPATAVEAFSQGTRNFYGMLAQSGNPDSTLFRVKDFLNGTGTIEDRYNQYMEALKFNKESAELAEGKRTLVMDKDMINHEVTQAMAYIADPTLFIPFGKVASTGLRAVGLGERLALAGARSAAIKNGIIGNTIKWGAGQPLEFMGGAVRNTIDFGLEKAGAAFEATTGIGAKEFAQTARMSGIGFSASAVAGHAVPYASTISDAYLVGSSARGFGEALTLVGETMKKNPFGRGVRSWAAESLKQAEKNGVALSPHAKGLLKTLDAVDPLFAYGWNGLETAAEGAMIGGGLGYLSGGEEGMYSGIGAGIALGAVGGTAGKVVADVTGGTNIARRAVQAKMTIEGQKVINAEKAMFFQAMQKAAEVRGKDVDLVNSIIIGIDEVAPNFEFHALTPDQFVIEAKKKGYDPKTGKFKETSALDVEFGGDRASKSKAMYVLRSVGGDFVGNRQGFLDALKKASAKDSANPNKPASNIPLALRKYIDVAKTFEKLSKTQQEAILKEIDGQTAKSTELGGKTKLREYYDALTWSEAWTDSIVKKFESDRDGARKDITDMLAQETNKKGELTSKGRALTDKLRSEGLLDKEGKLLRERNLLNADLTESQFKHSKGAVIGREADGKTHMYINLERMGDETFPHELFHTIMRESPMKKHFTDSLVTKLLGTVDKDGNLVRPAEVNIGQVTKFFKKYIELANRNPDGTLDVATADSIFKQVEAALTEYQNAGANKKISDKARGLLENYSEEFGAYYFSHWLMGRNRNTLFFGGELKGIEGLVERTKDSFMDFWQSKISKTNPEFDFSQGLNASFDRSKGLGRIGAIDYYMRDMVRAASNANREAFRPDAMTMDNLKDFERSNGIRNLTSVDSNRRLNPREQVTQNIRLGKEAYKILSGLDKNLRTSKDVLDENGKQVITGRLSENELDALVKGGIVPRAWADKVNQGYAMLDGTISNIFSAGYLGKTEQTTDASYPRLTGKDVAFKNRKAVLTGIDTKIKADGTFYTLFHTLDLAVIEQEANRLWQNTDYRNLWNGDRASMEADFFRYISNASKASTDPKKLDSAALLERGDGLGGQRRDVLHQMGRMALQTGDAYKHQPIAVIPEGIRHSVTTFNIDGMTMPRVETGTRYDINMGNAHKFIRENWQPDEMRQEKTPSGVLMTHESGFKFSNLNGKTTAYTSAGRKIGTFDNIKSATNAAKVEYNKVYNNIDKAVRDSVTEQDKNATKFQPLDENERAEAIRLGDVFALPSMKAFIGDRTLLRQTREEHIYQRALESIENPEQLLAYAEKINAKNSQIKAEYERMDREWNAKADKYEDAKSTFKDNHDLKIGNLRRKHKVPDDFSDWKYIQVDEGNWNPPKKSILAEDNVTWIINPEFKKHQSDSFAQYEADAKSAYARLFVDPEYIAQMELYGNWTESLKPLTKEILDESARISEFRKQNTEAIDNPITTALDTLGEYSTAEMTRAEKAGMFAKLVEANAKQKDYSGLLENLFADEYDDQIQTGKPFVAVTTHGTGNVELMLARLFAAEKLGSQHNIPSSKMGSFSAGSQNTSRAYARKPQSVDRSPAARFKRLTSFYNEEGMTDKTTEQYKLTQNFIDLYRGHLKTLGYDEATVEYTWRGFLHEQNPFNTSFELERFPQEVVDAWRKLVKKDNENLPPAAPERQMQLRKVIRMDNPYVVVDPRSYEEHYISPHMKRAIAAGHDGIIFKRFADGGKPDNVYVVFKDYMKDNIKVIDTSFDDVQVPRGNDETGRVLKGGKELNLAFQPTEGEFDFKPNSQKAYDLLTQYLYGLKTGKSHQEMMTPELYYVFKNIEQFTKASNDDIIGAILKLGDKGSAIVERLNNQEITLKQATEAAKNLDQYTYLAKLKDIRDARKGLYNALMRATGQMRKISDNDGRRLNTDAERESRNTRYLQPTDEAEIPLAAHQKPWSGNKFVLIDVKKFNDEFQRTNPSNSVRDVNNQKPNSLARATKWIEERPWERKSNREMAEAPVVSVFPEKTFIKGQGAVNQVRVSNGRHRLQAYEDLGIKYAWVQTPIKEEGRLNQFKVSEEGMSKENRTKFQPDEAEGGRTYTDAQFKNEFIGKIAAENPERIKNLTIKFGDNDIVTSEITSDSPNIALFENGDYVGGISYSLKKDNTAFISYSRIDPIVRGEGKGKLLYSELFERLRSMGVKEVTGNVGDTKIRPIKIRQSIHGDTEFYDNASKKWVKPSDKDFESSIIELQKKYESGSIEVRNKLDPNARYQPSEEDAYQGGRTYDFNSKQFKAGFLGLYAEQNPDRVKGISLQFMKRADGSHRIRLTDNSKKGESADIGHITANIDGDVATLSTHINEDFRGRKLAYVVYSEMAERLRAMGVTAVDGTIVNPDGVPIKVRERIIGDTRDLYSGRRINYVEGANRIRDKQEMVGSAGGIDVTNTLYKQARYQPAEGDNYRGTHKAPSGEDGAGSLDAMDRTYPDDLYSSQGARYYGSGDKTDKKMHELIMKFRGKPDAMVTVYRAVPKGVDASITKGDWVTPLREYAVLHGNRWEQGMTILEKKVKASELFTEGNSLYEFGWSPKEVAEADSLRKEIADQEKWIERSRNKAPIMWETKGSKIYGQREAMERKLSSLKYELKNLEKANKPKFQPTEGEQGGRTYTDKQMSSAFIGRYAAENKIFGLKINVSKNRTAGGRSVGDNRMVVQITKGNSIVGSMDIEQFGTTSAVIDYAEIKREFQGRGFGNLIYSEAIERLRSLGVKDVSGMVIDNNDRPIQIRKTIIDSENQRVGGEPTSIDATRLDEEGNKQTDVTSYLDKKAWYQPAEYTEFKSEQSPTGRIMRNAKGYVITMANNKFRVYNPAKAIIGVYGSEEEAKKRIYKDIPKQ